MLFLIVVISVFGIGLCDLLPRSGVYQEPHSRFPHYLALAKTVLPGLKDSNGPVVNMVTIRPMGGADQIIDIEMYINHNLCIISFVEHNNRRIVNRNTCTHVLAVGKRQLGGMPGLIMKQI